MRIRAYLWKTLLCQNVLCVLRILWEHSLCLLCWCCRGSCTSVVVFSHGIHGIHGMLGCVIGGVGMAGMPYPPNLCASVSICGRCFSARRFCVFRVFCGNSLPVCLFMSAVVFSHGIHGFPQMVRLCYWRRGYGRMPYPPNQCASVSICGRHFSARRFCVFRVFCGTLSVCFVGASVGGTSPLVSVRHPIRLRPPPNRFPSAVRSDSVRHPVRLRPLHDAISSVCILRRLHCNTPHVSLLHPFMFAKLRNKFDF